MSSFVALNTTPSALLILCCCYRQLDCCGCVTGNEVHCNTGITQSVWWAFHS